MKPHVFVKPRGALCPVQRPGEIRGAGGAGVSLTFAKTHVGIYLFFLYSTLQAQLLFLVNVKASEEVSQEHVTQRHD